MKEMERQLKTREGLIKVPKFASKSEEMDFYLNLQNPRTGAFMDDSFPFCTYTGPTGNVLNHLDELSKDTGRPIKLKYPLKYLDEIATPEKLRAYLDDVATVGWIGLKFPQTSFHFTRCLLSLFHEDSVVVMHGLYKVSPEWDRALLRWFYDTQDPETGVWGPRSKDGKLVKKDTQNTSSILKAFVDGDGKDLYKDFPLRYKNELLRTIIEEIDPVPKDDALPEWHEWNLKTGKSIKTLFKFLGDGISEETKAKAKDLAELFIRVKFEKFYVAKEGGFSYYPGSEHATLDGMGGMTGLFNDIGCFSAERQIRLWGGLEKTCVYLGEHSVAEITEADFREKVKRTDVNSFRVYRAVPESGKYLENVSGLFYPQKTSVLDVMELVPKMQAWVQGTSQGMGNWTSREDLVRSLAEMNMKPIPVLKESFPRKELNDTLRDRKKVVLLGFDILQRPICKIVYMQN